MEEQKIASKEIKLHPDVREAKKPSYESLEELCTQLTAQVNQMNGYIQKCHARMQQMDASLQTKRLDYLFSVVRYKDSFSPDFVGDCCAEIQDALTIPAGEEKNNHEGE